MTQKPLWLAVLLTALVWIGTVIVFFRLPEMIPTHWNIRGQADGFEPKWLGAFLTPVLMAGVLGLAWLLPRISPRRFEVDSFASTYGTVMLLAVALVGYIQVMVLWAGLNGRVDMGRAMFGGLFAFFALMGNYLGKVRRNFWMGIRTPWTLASDRVWNDTHRLAAKLFVGAGVAGLVVTLAGLPATGWLGVAFGLILMATLIPAGYSLMHYKRLQSHGEL
jgi:uncharacterized membrane protein